jgi:hypothetical protein
MPENKKRTKPPTGVNTQRIQAVLNRQYFRESPALDVYDGLLSQHNDLWTDRRIITEALIALGEKLDSGFKVAEVPDEVRVSSELILAFNKLTAFIDFISSMDLTQLRQVQGFDENVYNTLKAEGLKRGATRMLSDDTTFESEDW